MKEKDKINFYDTKVLTETPAIQSRCSVIYLSAQLKELFPDERLKVMEVSINRTGKYANKSQGFLSRKIFGGNISALPPYCCVRIDHSTGEKTEHIIVWSPLAWNDRFIGTGGGGYSTGGEQYITSPKNITRGLTLPFAVVNGFTAATSDAGCGKNNWAIETKTGALQNELVENWRAGSTHFMTVIGKAVAEILHVRNVRYAYFHGGSGGGRQAMAEAQEYPNDYNGIWASCPAINWTKFVLCGIWPIAVMNTNQHILTPEKIKYFMAAAQNSIGGKEKYYKNETKIEFDPQSIVGHQCKRSIISEKDAIVMREIWNGPKNKNGDMLWYGFRPGVQFWNVGIPVGSFYYTLFRKKPKPFFLSTHYGRWITQNPKQTFEHFTIKEFEELFVKSLSSFPTSGIDNADLSAFYTAGNKLIIDHGTDDPLIPVDGTIDYYQKVCKTLEEISKDKKFCKLFITPGDGHGTCSYHGPGITESDGMIALINWVEKNIEPKQIRTVLVDKKGDLIHENIQKSYCC